MNDSYIKIFEKNGKHDATQNEFGWIEGSGSASVVFESEATLDEEGITVAKEEGGVRMIGDMTAYPTHQPDFSTLETGQEAELTTETGNVVQAVVETVQPKGAFNGAIVFNRQN